MDANRDRLMAIIKAQSEIAASDLDTNQVMHLVAKRAQDITGLHRGRAGLQRRRHIRSDRDSRWAGDDLRGHLG